MADAVARECGADPALVADIALESLRKAAENYDPSKGYDFATYVSVILRNKFNDFLREENKVFDHETKILDNQIGQKEDSPLYITGEDRDFSKLRSRISECEYELIHRHFVEGVTLEKLGNELGVLRTTLHWRIHKILEKCRD